jgi:hypothetical protein
MSASIELIETANYEELMVKKYSPQVDCHYRKKWGVAERMLCALFKYQISVLKVVHQLSRNGGTQSGQHKDR